MDELQKNFHKQLAAVNNSWENFRYVRDKNSEWLQLAAIANLHSKVGSGDFIKLVDYIPAPASQKVLFNLAKLMQETIKRNCDYSWFRGECFNNKVLSWYSEYFKGASNFEKIAMLRCCGVLLCSIDNPTYEMMLEAVKSCGYAIDFIKNPSHELMTEAVKSNPDSVALIDGPVPEDIISIFLSEYPYLLNTLIGQEEMPISEELQLSALNKLLSEKGVGNVDEGVFKVLGSKRLQIYEETGHFPEDAKDGDKEEFVSVTGISENFSLSSEQVLLFNKILFNIRKFLLRRGLVGTARLYERSGVIYLTAGGVCYTYFNGKVSVKGIEGTNKEKETAVKFIEGTVNLLCSKVPFSIKSLKFSVSNDPLSSGSMVDSSDEPGSIDIVLK